MKRLQALEIGSGQFGRVQPPLDVIDESIDAPIAEFAIAEIPASTMVRLANFP